MNICVGGTFDPLHKGHRLLLDTAAGLACQDRLFIGITGNGFAQASRDGGSIKSFQERKHAVEEYLGALDVDTVVVEISNRYGIADSDPDLEAIVVSRETYPQAVKINTEREKNGLLRLHIFAIDLVRNSHGRIISGTLIRRGEMDPEGVEAAEDGGDDD